MINYFDLALSVDPNAKISTKGSSFIYEDLIWESEQIPKETLDGARHGLAQKQKWSEIQAERDRRSQLGGYKVGANWYHSDQPSRTQQIALVILGANLPSNIMWKTMSGSFVQMTPTLASQIFQTAVGSDQAIFGRAEQHRASMMQSSDPESYDFSGGWPLTYQEFVAAPPPAPAPAP